MAQDNPSFNFAEIAYDNHSDEDGYKLKGIVSLGEYFLLLADYSDISGTISGYGIDVLLQIFFVLIDLLVMQNIYSTGIW